MPAADPRLPRLVRHSWTLFMGCLAPYVAVLLAEIVLGHGLLGLEAHETIQFVLLACAAPLILVRARMLPDDRAAWTVLGLGTVVWLVGQGLTTSASPDGQQPPFPSPVDFGLMLNYVAQYTGLFLLARARLRGVARATWLDGGVAVLLLGALGVQWLFRPLLDAGGTVSQALVTLAYPTADAVLLALVLGFVVLSGGRPGLLWWRLGISLACTAAADAAFALQTASGVESVNVTTGPLALGFVLGGGFLLAAAMRPADTSTAGSVAGLRSLAVPTAFFVIVLGLLVFDSLVGLAPAPELLLTVAIGLIGLRAASAVRENMQLAESRRQALTDELTGLPNRRAAYAELDRRTASGRSVAVLMIDLDRFKELNDTLGHLVGDDALIAVAERLGGAVGGAGQLSRLGGDEFAVILPGADAHQALAIARRALDALDAPVELDDLLLPVRASIGVAALPADAEGSREELLRHADVAMYHAKSNSSGVELYAPDRDDHSRERLVLAAELQDAITSAQLVLHFQPKASLVTGEIAGVEALVRWTHPTRGLVSPAEFVPIVERSGLGRMLTLEVIDLALRAERDWRAAGLDVPVAVNTSAATLLDVRFPDDVAALLERWDAPPGSLSLELTEETIMTDPERAQDVLARLSELGIDLSLDDFGTGYSSLSMLKRLPVRELKIDRSFVVDVLDDPGDAAIVRSTVELARNLGLRVVAEGVETAEAWGLLAGWGCDLAQGYHLSRPVPEDELLGLLRARVDG